MNTVWVGSCSRVACAMRSNAGVAALFLGVFAATADAQVLTWSGTGASANWTATGNWGASSPPANGFSSGIIFAGSNLLSNTNTLTGGTATSLTFNSGASAFVISGSAITLGGAITNNSTSLQTINLDLTSAATRTLTLTAGGGNLALGGKLSGNGGYTLSGTGTVTISGTTNDYTGDTTFAANQTLNINSAKALGTGILVAGGNGFFNNTSGTDVTIANNFNASGGSPTFIGTGNLSITGTTTISGVAAGANRTITVNGGMLTLATLAASGANAATTGFQKSGVGTLAITGAADSSLQGRFQLTGGTLILGHNNAMGTGVFNINSNATLQASSELTGIINTSTLGAGLTVSGSNGITFSGPWTNSGGDRTLTSSLDAGKTLTLGDVFLSESTATGRLFTIAGTGNTTVGGVIANANGSGQPGRITITNTGLTIFSGANTYTGTTTVSGTGVRLRATDGVGLPASSILLLTGAGVLESSGVFSRTTGTSGGVVQFQAGTSGQGGFAAAGGDLTVSLNGGAELVYNSTPGWFNGTFGTALRLGSITANGKVTVSNPLDLNGGANSASRSVTLTDNPDSRNDYAEISGNIRNTGSFATALFVQGAVGPAGPDNALLVLSGSNSQDGLAIAGGAVVRAQTGVGLPSNKKLDLRGGILETSGSFTRAYGNGATQFEFWAGTTGTNGGFSAFGGKLTLVFNNTSTGTYTWGTSLRAGAPLKLNSIYSDNVVEWTNILDLNNAQREIFVNDNPTTSADSALISGLIAGTGASALLKTGPGILRLSGANTFAGGATITEGTLLVGVSDNGSTSGALGTAAAVVGGTSGSAAAAILVDGTFTLSRNITVQAGSTGAAALGGSNTSGTANFTGNITLNRSVTLQAAASGTVAFGTGSWTTNDNAVTIGSAGNTGVVRLANTLSSTSGVTVAFGTLVVPSGGGLGSGNPLAVSAGARANVDYANPALGGVTNSGSLAFGSTSGTATLAALSGGGTTAFSSDAAVTSLTGNTISIGSKNLAVASGTFGGSISGSGGSLTKTGAGRLEITAANSYTGATTIAGGTLALSGAGSLAGASAVALTAAGATFDIAGVSPTGITIGTFSGSAGSAVSLGSKNLLVNQSADAIFAGAIAGTGGLSKQGTATLTLTGTSSYTGATSVDAGRLLVGGQLGNTAVTVNAGGLLGGSGSVLGSVAVLAGGTFSPGSSPGLFTAGSMGLSGATLMEIDAVGVRGTAYDAVTVTNALTYGGTMEIDFAFLAALPNWTSFNLFDFGSQSGFFSGIATRNDGSYYGGLSFSGTGNVWTATKGSQFLTFTHSSGNLLIAPEPGSVVLAGLGVAVAAVLRRRRR